MNIKFYLLSQEFAAGDTCTYVGGKGSGLVAPFVDVRMSFGQNCGWGGDLGEGSGLVAHVAGVIVVVSCRVSDPSGRACPHVIFFYY